MKDTRKYDALPAVVAFIGAAFLTYALIRLDAVEFIYEFTRKHESWELDEILVVLMVSLVTGLFVLAISLYRALSRMRAAYRKLAMSHDQFVRMQQSPPLTNTTDPAKQTEKASHTG